MSTLICHLSAFWTAVVPIISLSMTHAAEPELQFPFRPGPAVLEAPANPNRHVECLGEQAGVWGSLADGFEGWAYPFKLFHGWSLFVFEDGERLVNMHSLARRQTAAPHFAQLEYGGSDWRLITTWFVPRSLPGALLLFDYRGRRDLSLVLRFQPSLAPMHMKAGGPLTSSWNEMQRELVVREPARGLDLRVRCPPATAHYTTNGEHEIRFTLPARMNRRAYAPIGISLGSPACGDPVHVMRQLLTSAEELLADAAKHYTRIIEGAPRVDTPDDTVNNALLWSIISLDQLRIRHPDLGYGLVSGYSSSRGGTRPRYCWFFEEPTLTSRAYHWLGMSDYIREAMRFLQRFQREDGKTVHEIVQSLPYWTNYFKDFPYAYLHSDGPIYYLFAYADYYRATADLAFIRAEWARIRKTLDWCFAAMDPKDGLMRIEPGDWGSAESSREVWKDTQLQGMWVRALRGMQRLAQTIGEPALANHCAQIAGQAEASIDARMWDHEAGTYLWGLDRQGRPLKSLVPHHAVSFWLGALPSNRVEQSLERMASADFRTDWGVRSLASSDPKYRPEDYQAGSVWPVWNAGVIVGDYNHHRSIDAFRNWKAMIAARALQGLGPMPEVLDGRSFQPLNESVPHQMFSELAIVAGFFEGLLGMQVDVPGRRVTVAPRLPPTWNQVTVRQIPCGPGHLDLRIQRSRTEYKITLNLRWPEGAHLLLAPELPAGSLLQSASLDGRNVKLDATALPASTRFALDLERCSGWHTLYLRHAGGVDWLPTDEPLTLGATNRNVRIVRAQWQDRSWRFWLEGLPGRDYPIHFFTDRSVQEVWPNEAGGEGEAGTGRPRSVPRPDSRLEKHKGGWRVVFAAPSDAATNTTGFVKWDSRVQFR